MKNTILVTGGAGYIGSHVVHALRAKGYECVVVDNLSSGFAHTVPEGVPLIISNYGDTNTIKQVLTKHKVDYIIHMAASTAVEESMRKPLDYYENNTVYMVNLLQAVVTAPIKGFIFSSTAAVYGDSAVDNVSEDEPKHPTSPYGASKLMAENILIDTHNAHALPYVIFRYFNVCGADPEMRTGDYRKNASHLFKMVCDAALKKSEAFHILGGDYPTADGTCIRDFIHVSDLADAHVAAIDYLAKGNPSSVFNCGYGHAHSVKEVSDTLQSLVKEPFPVVVSERRPGDIVRSVANVSRLKKMMNWQPKYDDLTTMVKSTFGWEQHLTKLEKK